jgi:fructose-bisphosphate aldolase, class I
MAAAEEYKEELIRTANALVSDGRGLLAADESTGSIAKRFKAVNVENTEDRRQSWREVLFTAPGELGKHLGGIITFEETLMKHKDSNGTPLVKVIKDRGIVPGIKTDKGTVTIAGTDGETTTQGLDGLAERSAEYYKQGARFSKWFLLDLPLLNIGGALSRYLKQHPLLLPFHQMPTFLLDLQQYPKLPACVPSLNRSC